jgi:hypothetical protein
VIVVNEAEIMGRNYDIYFPSDALFCLLWHTETKICGGNMAMKNFSNFSIVLKYSTINLKLKTDSSINAVNTSFSYFSKLCSSLFSK